VLCCVCVCVCVCVCILKIIFISCRIFVCARLASYTYGNRWERVCFLVPPHEVETSSFPRTCSIGYSPQNYIWVSRNLGPMAFFAVEKIRGITVSLPRWIFFSVRRSSKSRNKRFFSINYVNVK